MVIYNLIIILLLIIPGDPNISNNKRTLKTPPLPSHVRAEEHQDFTSDLGPLPSNWEKAFTEKGEIYFIE